MIWRSPPALLRGGDESGSVLPFVALAGTSLLLFMVLALDSGRLYLARTQLQIAADNAARAALHAAYNPDKSVSQSRTAGRRASELVVSGSSVVDGGAELQGADLSFGLYDPRTGKFSPEDPEATAVQRPGAVRIALKRRSGSARGALGGLFASMNVTAESIASMRCRQVAVVTDLSGSFIEELPDVKAALRAVVGAFADGSTRGDTLALVSHNARGTDHNDPAKPIGRVEVPLQAVTASEKRTYDRRIDDLNTCNSLACEGTNTDEGLRAGRKQLENLSSTCPGDRLLVLLGDGVPCARGEGATPEERKEDARRKTEALRTKALDEAALTEQDGVSITSIFIHERGQATCEDAGYTAGGDGVFMESLKRGEIGQYFEGTPREIKDLLSTSVGGFPIVMVQ